MKKIFLLIIIMIFALSFNLSAENIDINPDMRVLILDNKDVLHVSIKDAYKICALDTGRVLNEGARLSARVTPSKDGIEIGAKEYKMRGIKIVPQGVARIYVDGRLFRGDIDIVRKENYQVMVINHIPLDEYLYGVLYHEVSHRWPMEALKAQAIASRSFALYQARQNRLQPYDLRSDIYSQVYGGSTSERWSTTMAVNVTKGKVLAYKGDLIPTYFHATCAGHTEDASSLWNIDLPSLRGGVCSYCGQSKYFSWIKEIPLWKLEEILNKNGYKINKIASFTILSKNRSGRVDKIEIKDASGVTVVLTGKDFRQIVGPNELRSTKFNAFIRLGSLVIEGNGWGHGVGMCQWGVYGMASAGKRVEEILSYYYPGTEIILINKLKDKK